MRTGLLILCVVGIAACSGSSANVVDAGTNLDAATSPDAMVAIPPPISDCLETARRFVLPAVASPGDVDSLAIASVRETQVVAAVLRDRDASSLQVWRVSSADPTGATVATRAALPNATSVQVVAGADGSVAFATTTEGAWVRVRVPTSGSAETSEATLPTSQLWLLADVGDEADTFIGAELDDATSTIRLMRAIWTRDGVPEIAPLDGESIAAGRGGRLYGGLTKLGTGEYALALSVAAPASVTISVFVSSTASSITQARVLPGNLSVAPRGPIVAFGAREALAVVQTSPDSLWRLSAAGGSLMLTLPPSRQSESVAADLDGPLLAAIAPQEGAFTDPEEIAASQRLLVMRVRNDGSAVDGAPAPLLTGRCTRTALSSLGHGALVVASNCLNMGIDLTYLCERAP